MSNLCEHKVYPFGDTAQSVCVKSATCFRITLSIYGFLYSLTVGFKGEIKKNNYLK